jgi:hypothetical protein
MSIQLDLASLGMAFTGAELQQARHAITLKQIKSLKATTIQRVLKAGI